MKKTISVVSLLTLSIISVSYASIDKNLKYGQRDKEVTELQEFLIDKGLLKTSPSNFFGLLTLKAVKAYQTSIGVSSTGFVGVLTREKINKEIENEVASSNEAERAETPITTNTIQTNTQVTANTNHATTSNDSIYDSNLKIDKLGRKVTITQDPNYKFLNTVRAKVDILGSTTITGFFYKDTKTFLTENDISLQQSITEDQLKNKSNPANNLATTQIDYCKNIEGIQTKIPDNMLVGNDSVCFTKQTGVVTPIVNVATSYVAPVEQPKPFTRLTVRLFEGKLYIESSKDIDFSSITFTRPVCVPLPVSGCTDWTNTLTIPITVTMLEKKVYEADSSQSRNYVASLSNNNFRDYLTDDEKVIANNKDIGYSLKTTISSTDGVVKVFNGSALLLKDGGFNLNF